MDSTNVRGVSWSVLRGRCAAPQHEVVGSYESFLALNAKVPFARRPAKCESSLSAFLKNSIKSRPAWQEIVDFS
jgi:hypothetical protein